MRHGSLALKLRVLRAERALTIEQAAERAGVQPETISDAERGRRRPYLPTLRKLAAAYEVPVEEILQQEAEPVPFDAASEAGRSEVQGPEETHQEISLLDVPKIVDWLVDHGLRVGAVDDETFMNYVLDLGLEELDVEGRPLAVMELGRDLTDEQDKARDLLWTKSKYRSLGGLLSVDPAAPVAEQKNQRHDQLSKLRRELDRRYGRRARALRRYAELLTELPAAQKKSATVSSIGQPRQREALWEQALEEEAA